MIEQEKLVKAFSDYYSLMIYYILNFAHWV